MKKEVRIALTGFMGVGKSSVARHLSNLLECRRVDLDALIEEREGRGIAEIIDSGGIEAFRLIESDTLKTVLMDGDVSILSLGGGTWTIAGNREAIKKAQFTSIWLESTFEHCWYNIKFSRKERPLARNKAEALKLFEERQKVYCLADWHFIIKAEFNSFEIAAKIVEEIF